MNQREAFEAWAKRACCTGTKQGINFERITYQDGYESYENPHVETAWQAWLAALASQWRQIETAPKDGERILGWCQVEADVVYWRLVNGEHRWMSDAAVDFGGHETPTHWMPLPSEPTE